MWRSSPSPAGSRSRSTTAIAEALEDPAGWQGEGIATAEHWVALRCGVTSARARRVVTMARPRTRLPEAASAGRGGRRPGPARPPLGAPLGERMEAKWISWS